MISRKTIREFFEKEMYDKLFSKSIFTRDELTLWVEDKIEFINAIREYLPQFVSFTTNPETGDREITFYLDPCDVETWNNVMDEIYTPERSN